MTEDDIALIRSMKWRHGANAESLIAIIGLWNDGYSAKHIAQILSLPDAGAINKGLAAVRTRTSIKLRIIGGGGHALEHPSWWTPERTALGEALWMAGDLNARKIGERLGCNDNTVQAKAKSENWIRLRMTVKPKGQSAHPSPTELNVRAIAASAGKGVVFQIPPNAKPKPFWQVSRQDCQFIFGDARGEMDLALTCGNPGYPYCEEHTALCCGATWGGRKPTERDLVRSLRGVR